MTQLNFGGQRNLIENVKKTTLKNCIWNSQTQVANMIGRNSVLTTQKKGHKHFYIMF